MYIQLELPIDQAVALTTAVTVAAEDRRTLKPIEAPVTREFPVVAADPPQPFGLWLLTQQERRGLIGALAKAARADAGFPKRGTADDVRSRLTSAGAEGDMFEAIDDAEAAWLAED